MLKELILKFRRKQHFAEGPIGSRIEFEIPDLFGNWGLIGEGSIRRKNCPEGLERPVLMGRCQAGKLPDDPVTIPSPYRNAGLSLFPAL